MPAVNACIVIERIAAGMTHRVLGNRLERPASERINFLISLGYPETTAHIVINGAIMHAARQETVRQGSDVDNGKTM